MRFPETVLENTYPEVLPVPQRVNMLLYFNRHGPRISTESETGSRITTDTPTPYFVVIHGGPYYANTGPRAFKPPTGARI